MDDDPSMHDVPRTPAHRADPIIRVGMTAHEWQDVREWLDATGYSTRLPHETLDDWRKRTSPISYQYALIVEAACFPHVYNAAECVNCGIIR